jgi:catechol 1,2-dioxygenase
MSDSKRNEGQLLQDILGLESLVDEITYTLANEATDQPTATAVAHPINLNSLTPPRSLAPSGGTVPPSALSETPSSTKTKAAT